jgi:hypothetical protein
VQALQELAQLVDKLIKCALALIIMVMKENVATQQINLLNVKTINMEHHLTFVLLIPEQKWVNCGTVIVQGRLIQNVGL